MAANPGPWFRYYISIKTGDYGRQNVKKNEGVACLRIHDENGPEDEHHKIKMNIFAGQTITKTIKSTKADVKYVEVWIERTANRTDLQWFVNLIQITKNDPGVDVTDAGNDQNNKYFPCHCWITLKHKFLALNNSLIPQADSNKQQRHNEIVLVKEDYLFKVIVADSIPINVDFQLPADSFSNDYFGNVFLKAGLFNGIKEKLIPTFAGKWRRLQDTKNVYDRTILKFPIPRSVDTYLDALKDKNWEALDEVFGKQRLIGTNPAVIRRVRSIDFLRDRFGKQYDELDTSPMKYLPEDTTLEMAIEEDLLYVVDYTDVLYRLPCQNGLVAAPIALFVINKQRLMPIAIRLFKDASLDNPIFFPSDAPFTWFSAKMWFNNADASYHQSASHLGFTHLLIETIYLALRQNVPVSHPLYRLMAPHFLYILSVNKAAWNLLINAGGWVDNRMTIGVKGMVEIIRRRYKGVEGVSAWRLDVEGDVANDIEERGVGKKDDEGNYKLPHYYFRDDALDLQCVIRKYVKTVVENHYKENNDVIEDNEIQSWGSVITKTIEEGGSGLQGVPGDGEFKTIDQVIDMVTSVIYISSVAHAAVNFQQYDEYGYPLNYPTILYGDPPRNKTIPLKEKDVLKELPTKPATLAIMNMTSLLSQRATQSLGDFEVQYQYDPVAKAAVAQFQKDLGAVSKKIRERNKTLDSSDKYCVLDPMYIPNAISI